jgi:hypothetical protein
MALAVPFVDILTLIQFPAETLLVAKDVGALIAIERSRGVLLERSSVIVPVAGSRVPYSTMSDQRMSPAVDEFFLSTWPIVPPVTIEETDAVPAQAVFKADTAMELAALAAFVPTQAVFKADTAMELAAFAAFVPTQAVFNAVTAVLFRLFSTSKVTDRE